jgi:hypothetical protein
MYQNSINELPKLKNYNYENIFNVYQDTDNRYFYNLLQTISIPDNLPEGYYDEYNVVYGDTWPFISFKVYENPNLWWLITSVNSVINPTIQPEVGTRIKILKSRFASFIISQITTQKF